MSFLCIYSLLSSHGNDSESEEFAVFGHTATVVDETMIVIFGHNSVYGYVTYVQEFNFSKTVVCMIRSWSCVMLIYVERLNHGTFLSYFNSLCALIS